MPVQAMVIRFELRLSPQVTNTAGSGLSIVPGFQLSFIQSLFEYISEDFSIRAFNGMVAIAAADYSFGLALHNVKLGRHGFVVGDALRIGATHYAYYCIGQCYRMLLYNVVIVYYINYGCGSYKGYAVESAAVKDFIGNFYYTFCAEFLACEITTYGYCIATVFETQYFYSLKQC